MAGKYIIVLTVSSTELSAVEKHLSSNINQDGLRLSTAHGDKLDVSQRFQALGDHTLVVLCWRKAGPEIAFVLAYALGKFAASLVIFAGIGGGIPGRVSHGTVILSDQIGDHTLAKEVGQTILFSPQFTPVDGNLTKMAHAVVDEQKWQNRIKDHPTPGNNETISPNAIIGAISAGTILVESVDGPLIESLKEISQTNVLAVDMESAFCFKCSKQHRIPFIAIRGISDLLMDRDAERDRTYRQPIAAAHASAVAFEMIDHFIAREGKKKMSEERQMEDGLLNSDQNPLPERVQPTGNQKEEGETGSGNFADPSIIAKLNLRPARYRGTTLKLQITFRSACIAVPEEQCHALNLEFRNAVYRKVDILMPKLEKAYPDFLTKIFAEDRCGDWLENASEGPHSVIVRFESGSAIGRKPPLSGLDLLVQAGLVKKEEAKNEPLEVAKYFSGLILQDIVT